MVCCVEKSLLLRCCGGTKKNSFAHMLGHLEKKCNEMQIFACSVVTIFLSFFFFCFLLHSWENVLHGMLIQLQTSRGWGTINLWWLMGEVGLYLAARLRRIADFNIYEKLNTQMLKYLWSSRCKGFCCSELGFWSTQRNWKVFFPCQEFSDCAWFCLFVLFCGQGL